MRVVSQRGGGKDREVTMRKLFKKMDNIRELVVVSMDPTEGL